MERNLHVAEIPANVNPPILRQEKPDFKQAALPKPGVSQRRASLNNDDAKGKASERPVIVRS